MIWRKFLPLGFIALSSISTAMAAPALWQVKDADSSVWIFGSIHLLPKDTEWRTPLLDKVLSDADTVYFETDLSPKAMAEVAVLSMEIGFVSDGPLLSQRLDAALLKKIRQAAQLYDVPMPTLLAMRPWLAATTLQMAALTQAGYDPTHGIDVVLYEEVPADRRGAFETAQEQVAFIAGDDEAEGVQLLEGTLKYTGQIAEMTDQLKAAWLAGEIHLLDELIMADIDAFGAAYFDRLLNQRNRDWVGKIATMLDTNEEALIVVGAAHVIGEFGLVPLLESGGFTSERLQ